MINLNENFWSERYQKRETGWDIGDISTPLKNYFDQLTNRQFVLAIGALADIHAAHHGPDSIVHDMRGACVMPGLHFPSECHTAADYEQQHGADWRATPPKDE